jgi:hypothetical protein
MKSNSAVLELLRVDGQGEANRLIFYKLSLRTRQKIYTTVNNKTAIILGRMLSTGRVSFILLRAQISIICFTDVNSRRRKQTAHVLNLSDVTSPFLTADTFVLYRT